MAKTEDFTKYMTDMMGAFPVDTAAMQDAFKAQAEMAEKISFGRLNKFFKENTLMNQAFIKDNKKSIKDYLQEDNKERSVTTFTRYALS